MSRDPRASGITCLLALAVATPAHADTATAPGAAVTPAGAGVFTSKKQALVEAKEHARETAHDPGAEARWQRELDRRIGQKPEAVVNLYNTWTHEVLALPRAAAAPGQAQADSALMSADTVNRFLRCHFTNQPTDMDARLLPTLMAAAAHFDVTRIDIVSGFRSPKYNRILRKKGREVSRKSQHPQGNAVDFRLPGVPVSRVHAWAKNLRLGGVGLYRQSGFIHMDTARIRYWTGR
jgi:uncharacterized protein YcbK (DUF882 family)